MNARPFKDPFLIRAAEAGYRSAIHPGDRPSMLLRVDAPPEDVDVNVHPAKLEVRFRDRIGVERVVEEAVRDALGALVAAAPVGDWRGMPGMPALEHSAIPLLGGPTDLFAPSDATEPAASEPAASRFDVPILQLFDTYLVYEGPDGVVIVDQHSAHERVLFETVMAQLTGDGAPAQRLLLPLTVDLTDEELDAVESHGEQLRRVGFEVEPFGGRAVVLHTVPAPHPRFDAGACFVSSWPTWRGGDSVAGPIGSAVRGHVRLPGGGEGRPASRRPRAARAAASTLRHRAAAPRRPRTRDDRAAPAGGAGAPVWAALTSPWWSDPRR